MSTLTANPRQFAAARWLGAVQISCQRRPENTPGGEWAEFQILPTKINRRFCEIVVASARRICESACVEGNDSNDANQKPKAPNETHCRKQIRHQHADLHRMDGQQLTQWGVRARRDRRLQRISVFRFRGNLSRAGQIRHRAAVRREGAIICPSPINCRQQFSAAGSHSPLRLTCWGSSRELSGTGSTARSSLTATCSVARSKTFLWQGGRRGLGVCRATVERRKDEAPNAKLCDSRDARSQEGPTP